MCIYIYIYILKREIDRYTYIDILSACARGSETADSRRCCFRTLFR